MTGFLKIGLPCLLLAVSAPTLWSIVTTHNDSFDKENLLQVDAAELKTTCVTPHLETPIQDGVNVLWCGTFQLAWNEICTLVGENLHFAGNEPAMVSVLDKKTFVKDDLDDASYVALADYVKNGIFARIPSELQRKFGGQASPKYLPSAADAPRPQDIVAYSYLFKNLAFEVVFERIEKPVLFDAIPVSCFGIDDVFKPEQMNMYPQLLVIDYLTSDDFVIELRTKSKDDRVILAKTRPGKTLRETIVAVQDRMARAKPTSPSTGDVLKVPRFNFDITRHYGELIGLRLAIKNPAVAKDLRITSAVQNTRFQMDEKGVKLKSESHISLGCSAEMPPPRTRVMIFDKPFLVMLQRTDAETPYFAMWIGNAELLQRAGVK